MKRPIALLALCLAAFANAADDDAGSAAIGALGQINGVALACQQPAIASRARYAVQITAPKTRASGEIFEQATSAAFLEQGKGLDCPNAAALVERLETAERQLQKIYPATR